MVCSFSDISTLWNFSNRIWPTEPCTQILWIDRAEQSKACRSVSAKGKIEEYGVGALLLPSSSLQNHELTIDHISIMKLPAFWCISQDQCLNLSGLAKCAGTVQEMSALILSYILYVEIGSLCARNTTLEVLRWFPSEVKHRTETGHFRQKRISNITVTPWGSPCEKSLFVVLSLTLQNKVIVSRLGVEG